MILQQWLSITGLQKLIPLIWSLVQKKVRTADLRDDNWHDSASAWRRLTMTSHPVSVNRREHFNMCRECGINLWMMAVSSLTGVKGWTWAVHKWSDRPRHTVDAGTSSSIHCILFTLPAVCTAAQFSKQVSASRSCAGWLTVCSHGGEWPEHFTSKPPLVWLLSDVMQRSWQREEQPQQMHSDTPRSPEANAPTQIPAWASGRGDKTHQVTFPLRMVPALSCHRRWMPPRQALMVIRSDRNLSAAGRVQRRR